MVVGATVVVEGAGVVEVVVGSAVVVGTIVVEGGTVVVGPSVVVGPAVVLLVGMYWLAIKSNCTVALLFPWMITVSSTRDRKASMFSSPHVHARS